MQQKRRENIEHYAVVLLPLVIMLLVLAVKKYS